LHRRLCEIGIAGLPIGFQILNIESISEQVNCLREKGFQWLLILALFVIYANCLIACILTALIAIQVKEFYYPDEIKTLLESTVTKNSVIVNFAN